MVGGEVRGQWDSRAWRAILRPASPLCSVRCARGGEPGSLSSVFVGLFFPAYTEDTQICLGLGPAL